MDPFTSKAVADLYVPCAADTVNIEETNRSESVASGAEHIHEEEDDTESLPATPPPPEMGDHQISENVGENCELECVPDPQCTISPRKKPKLKF